MSNPEDLPVDFLRDPEERKSRPDPGLKTCWGNVTLTWKHPVFEIKFLTKGLAKRGRSENSMHLSFPIFYRE